MSLATPAAPRMLDAHHQVASVIQEADEVRAAQKFSHYMRTLHLADLLRGHDDKHASVELVMSNAEAAQFKEEAETIPGLKIVIDPRLGTLHAEGSLNALRLLMNELSLEMQRPDTFFITLRVTSDAKVTARELVMNYQQEVAKHVPQMILNDASAFKWFDVRPSEGTGDVPHGSAGHPIDANVDGTHDGSSFSGWSVTAHQPAPPPTVPVHEGPSIVLPQVSAPGSGSPSPVLPVLNDEIFLTPETPQSPPPAPVLVTPPVIPSPPVPVPPVVTVTPTPPPVIAPAPPALPAPPANAVPTVSIPAADQAATQGSAFTYTLAAGSFADADAADVLSYTASLGGGAPLPGWLAFDGTTLAFTGTPANADVGTISVRVTANDGHGGTISDTFDIVVANVNDAPTVDQGVADQTANEDSAFSFAIPANAFEDIDVADVLTYSAVLAGGGALPGWLSFNAATRTFSGTPVNGDVGSFTVRVTATDGSAASITNDFTITVANTNDAPTVSAALIDQTATENGAFSYQFAAGSFAEVDAGDALTYSATLSGGGALPSWLSFNATTRTFSGTPANGDVGTINITVTADDGHGGTASDTFALAVADVNNLPTLNASLPDQSATEDGLFTSTLR